MSYRTFFDNEAVRSVKDPLARLLRVIFTRRKLTVDDFVRLHGEYWNRWNIREKKETSEVTHRNNQRRVLLDPEISWKKFHFITSSILRLVIIRISITIRDESGKEITYSNDDAINILTPPDDPE